LLTFSTKKQQPENADSMLILNHSKTTVTVGEKKC